MDVADAAAAAAAPWHWRLLLQLFQLLQVLHKACMSKLMLLPWKEHQGTNMVCNAEIPHLSFLLIALF
eukprot:12935216-Prorocentrum_lima.AAC.1